MGEKDLKTFLKSLGFALKSEMEETFEESFTHRSRINGKWKDKNHNERLEFLGDAVLELISTEFLFKKFPEKPEGDLTAIRSGLVRKDNLAKVAQTLNLSEFLILSSSEKKSGGKNKDYLLANLLEAFIGALYLCFGYQKTEIFIQEYVFCELPKLLETKSYINAKSKLQEYTQKPEIGVTPQYKVLQSTGKDHNKTFLVGVYIKKELIAQASGGSKKEAESLAAAEAFKKIKN